MIRQVLVLSRVKPDYDFSTYGVKQRPESDLMRDRKSPLVFLRLIFLRLRNPLRH